MTIQQRSPFRHEDISLRHRKWGPLGLCDIDAWYTLELRGKRPVALVSYKREGYKEALESEMTADGFIALGELAHLPVFEVIYSADLTVYIVEPKNTPARGIHTGGIMDEHSYVSLLYRLRRMSMPRDVKESLRTAMQSWSSV